MIYIYNFGGIAPSVINEFLGKIIVYNNYEKVSVASSLEIAIIFSISIRYQKLLIKFLTF